MNKAQKGKTGLIVLSIIGLLLGIGCIVGGIIMIVNGAIADALVAKILLIVFGIIVAIIGLPLIAFGITYLWTGSSLVATKGTVTETNEVAKGGSNKKCPKCGATNTKDSVVCQVCGEKLD